MGALRKLLSESKNFMLLAALLMLFGAWMGYANHEMFMELIAQVFDQLEELLEQTEENDSPAFMAGLIFGNNVRAALMMLGLGAIIFIIPAISLFVNGLAVGFILKVSAIGGISPLALFTYGILPHGILELPAIIMAGGIGIFLGWRLVRWIFRMIALAINPDGRSGEHFREETQPVLKTRLKGLAIFTVGLVIVLFFAAVIEGYVTPGLLEQQMEQISLSWQKN
ncbi:stage II sporulation protein M [Bacillus horti]|nr:stage II sporulation protein M [Bacillus horti]